VPELSEDAGGLIVSVPVQPRLGSAGVYAGLLAGWAGLWTWLLGRVLGQWHTLPSTAVLAFVLPLAGAAALGVRLLYRLCGREVIRLSKHTLDVRHEVLGLGWTRCFEAVHIRAMRFFPDEADARHFGLGAGMRFEYGERTYWFGERISREDAARLLAAMSKRFRLPELTAPGQLDRPEGDRG